MNLKIGDRVKASPYLTDLNDWIEGYITDIQDNPFMGQIITIKDDEGIYRWGQSKYFVAA